MRASVHDLRIISGKPIVFPGYPKSEASPFDLFVEKAFVEVANVETAIGRVGLYLMYAALINFLRDNKQEIPADLTSEFKKAFGRLPMQELTKLKMPKIMPTMTAKNIRDMQSDFLRWNRVVRENNKVPVNERNLLTLGIRNIKEGVSKTSIASMEKLAWVISSELGAKVQTVLHDSAGGSSKRAANVEGLHDNLKAVVKSLTGRAGLTIGKDQAATLRDKKPLKYKEYTDALAALRKQFEIDWRAIIVANDNKPITSVEAEKQLARIGYELMLIPTKSMGYTGKIGLDQGKLALFTQNDRLLVGNIAPGSKVTMNPKYSIKDDNAYYMTVQAPDAVTTGNRIYTTDYKKTATVSKFNKATQVAANLPKLLQKWATDLSNKDPMKKMESAAAIVLYYTSARVGSNSSGMSSNKGVEAFGILNLRRKHVKITATSVIIKYPGKKGVAQEHKIPKNNAVLKKIGSIFDKLVEDKKPDDFLWELPALLTGKKKRLTYNDFNNYIKSTGFTQGAHKLRHVRGTDMVRKLIETTAWKASKAATTLSKKQREADTFMRDKILSKAANLLGHKTTTAGGSKPAWQTTIKSYVQPDIVRQWFVDNSLDVPKWVPSKVTD